MYKDSTACHVLLWLFTAVNRKTGKLKTGRLEASKELGLNNNTFYKALKRLEKKYDLVTCSSNYQYTEITLINWAKYQADRRAVTGVSNSVVTARYQRGNTITRSRREKRDNNILSVAQKVPVKTNPYQRLPEDKQQEIHRVVYYLEDRLNTTIVNWGKQANAYKMMKLAGYTESQVRYVIDQMLKSDFFIDNGFDLMTVANQIDKYKARDTRRKYAE